MSEKRIAIVGTAPSWRDAPFTDPSIEIWGLNDAYTLGWPRASRWFEQHPLDKLYFRPVAQKVVYAEDVPTGYYVRPEGHLDRLRDMARTIPVYLQGPPPAGWPPHAQRFPLEDVDARLAALCGDETGFGYWASGPAYMVALAILEGATEIQVWGIHLETEHEYRLQRANFEHILGIARGRGIKVVMAPQSPVLKHGWRYAYEPKPAEHPIKPTLRKAQQEKAQMVNTLARLPWWRRRGPLQDRLRRAEALEQDCLWTLQQRAPIRIVCAA